MNLILAPVICHAYLPHTIYYTHSPRRAETSLQVDLDLRHDVQRYPSSR